MRTGLWFSGAGGSGVLIARMADGTWSPPSGILLHTAATGFSNGIDIYDCVLVLNTQPAVDAFSKWRLTLGGELSAVAGPFDVGGSIGAEVNVTRAPMFTYLRSRGLQAGAQVDGTVVSERTDENEKFYSSQISVSEILAGKVEEPPAELRMLAETLKAAQGDEDVNKSLLPTEAPPSDFEVVKSDQVFGIPDREDPDPFGVLALEKEGFLIKEAGSQIIAPTEEFEFRPSATSPIFDQFNRRSFESVNGRSSWRSSTITMTSTDHRPKYVTMDSGMQTDFDNGPPSTGASERSKPILEADDEHPLKVNGVGATQTQTTSSVHNSTRSVDVSNPLGISHTTISTTGYTELDKSQSENNSRPMSPTHSLSSQDSYDSEADSTADEEEEPVVIHEVQQAARPQSIIRPRIVTVPARLRPSLPSRNPSRAIRGAGASLDQGTDTSPPLSSLETETQAGAEHLVQGSTLSTSPPPSSPSLPKSEHSPELGSSAAGASLSPPTRRSISPVPISPVISSSPITYMDGASTSPPPSPPRTNGNAGPRISLMSMKMSLADDDDDDDDRSPSPRRSPMRSPALGAQEHFL